MSKLIFVLLDACGYDVMTEYAGYLEHCVQTGQGAKYRVRGELPSMSRVMYATLLSGLTASQHGITSNSARGMLRAENIFSLCRRQGLTTAAAAYCWMSELLNTPNPFDLSRDRIQTDSGGAIQHGLFYSEDSYPDTHLFADAEFLRTRFAPDLLLIHPMNIDLMGHRHGRASREYAWAAFTAAEHIGLYLPRWLGDGYSVLVTADHGMNDQGLHGGTTDAQRMVPLYVLDPSLEKGDFTDREISHLNIAPLACKILGLPPAPGMLAELSIRFADTGNP